MWNWVIGECLWENTVMSLKTQYLIGECIKAPTATWSSWNRIECLNWNKNKSSRRFYQREKVQLSNCVLRAIARAPWPWDYNRSSHLVRLLGQDTWAHGQCSSLFSSSEEVKLGSYCSTALGKKIYRVVKINLKFSP